MNTRTCPVNREFKPYSSDYLADPVHFYKRWSEEMPVSYVPEYDLYLVSRYEDIVGILRDTETFSAANATAPFRPVAPEAAKILATSVPRNPTFTSADAPRHPIMRAAAMSCLTPRRWEASRPELQRYLEELIEKIAQKPVANLADDLITPFTTMAGFRLLGFPIEDRAKVLDWCARRVMLTYGDASAEEQAEGARHLIHFWNYCREFVESRLARPEDDLTSDLLAYSTAHADLVTTEDVVNMVYGLALASHETTSAAIQNGILRLMLRRQDWDALRADPALMPNAVEELLRFDSPLSSHRRIAKKDTVIGGIAVPAKATILMLIGSANHDGRHFKDPETFDVRRKEAIQHLTFGRGAHFCLGAPLARYEYGLVLQRLTQRLPNLRLAEGQAIRYLPVILLRMPYGYLVEPGVVSGTV